MAQRYPSEPLLTVSRIQYRVPRRTVSAHPALTVQPPGAAVANGQKAPDHGRLSAESNALPGGDARLKRLYFPIAQRAKRRSR